MQMYWNCYELTTGLQIQLEYTRSPNQMNTPIESHWNHMLPAQNGRDDQDSKPLESRASVSFCSEHQWGFLLALVLLRDGASVTRYKISRVQGKLKEGRLTQRTKS